MEMANPLLERLKKNKRQRVYKKKGSQDFVHTFSMALYHKWDVKNSFAFVLQLFSLISDSEGGVRIETFVQKLKRS